MSNFEVQPNKTREGVDCFAVMDVELKMHICCQNYDTLEEAEAGLLEWQRVEGINTAIEEALEDLESLLCNDFGVGDIEPARKLIRAHTRFGY